ncbi:MAG: SUMF1/EgtB/PvdO family nonheme iron enzyme [Verrucomicrobia bacterium]|nr:SUMF1/EgtB/PvdO family nonheme iron enzyme [Verrucomicrobiota bacterium]
MKLFSDDSVLAVSITRLSLIHFLSFTSCVLGLAAYGEDAAPTATVTVTSSPAAASKEKPFENSLGMRFAPVPITAGSTKGQNVLFSVWETRRKDYAAYASANTGVDQSWKSEKYFGHPLSFDQTHPVVRVSWPDAVDFCKWLTSIERRSGKIGRNDTYRLPTDTEWSFAVGIGEREDSRKSPKENDLLIENVYPWGVDWPPPSQAGNYKNRGIDPFNGALGGFNDYVDGYLTTAPVGSYKANKHGLFDLGGNVWEICNSLYDPKDKLRVVRGGGWGVYGRIIMLSSYRSFASPDDRYAENGFRCVLVVTGS